MPYNGSGVFSTVYTWVVDAANGVDITASRFDSQDGDMATGFTNCVTRDGQGKMGADFIAVTANAYALGTASVPWTQVITSAFTSTKTASSAWGPAAAALVDTTPDTGTFTMTLAGISGGTPTTSCTWYRYGKVITLFISNSVSGISTSTTFILTGIPSVIQPPSLTQTTPLLSVSDNGTVISASLVIAPGSGSWQMFKPGGGSFTASGAKGFQFTGQIITYLLV